MRILAGFKSIIKKLSNILAKKPWLALAVVVALVLMITQTERLIRTGKFFGYQVIDKSGIRAATDTEKQRSAKSQMCKDLSSDTVGKILDKDLVATSYFPDRTGDAKFTSCSYVNSKQNDKHKNNPVVVTVSSQQYKSRGAAEDFLAKLDNNNFKLVAIEGFDKALHSADSSQLYALKGDTLKIVWLNKLHNDSDNYLELQKKILQALE